MEQNSAIGKSHTRTVVKNMYKKELGNKGEDLAAEYLCSLGYSILRQNYRSGRNEIDIVAMNGKTLVFVEVKTRTSSKFGIGSEAITRQKILSIRRAAGRFLADLDSQQGPRRELVRFDAVIIDLSNSISIEHLENIF